MNISFQSRTKINLADYLRYKSTLISTALSEAFARRPEQVLKLLYLALNLRFSQRNQ